MRLAIPFCSLCGVCAAVPLEVAGYRHSLVASRRTCGRDLLRPRDTATRWLCPLRLRGHNWQLKHASAEGKWQKSVGRQQLFVEETATVRQLQGADGFYWTVSVNGPQICSECYWWTLIWLSLIDLAKRRFRRYAAKALKYKWCLVDESGTGPEVECRMWLRHDLRWFSKAAIWLFVLCSYRIEFWECFSEKRRFPDKYDKFIMTAPRRL